MTETAHFQFYGNFKENIKKLPKDEQLDFYDKLTDYGLYGTESEFENPYLEIIFDQMKFAIDNQRTRGNTNRENGRKGGRPKTESCLQKPTETENNPNKPNETETAEKEVEEELEKEAEGGAETEGGAGETAPDAPKGAIAAVAAATPPEKPRTSADSPRCQPERRNAFKPPTLEEVREYCAERKNGVKPERFVDFYASKGWLVGKNKMTDWRAAVRTWERRDKDDGRRDTAWRNDDGAADKYLDKF